MQEMKNVYSIKALYGDSSKTVNSNIKLILRKVEKLNGF